MKLLLYCNAFKKVVVPGIDPTTISFHGSIEGYSHTDPKSNNCLGVRLLEPEKTEEIYNQIKAEFNLNTDRCKPEDYIKLRTTFEDYEKDKRPKLIFLFPSGYAGMRNEPSFSIEPE